MASRLVGEMLRRSSAAVATRAMRPLAVPSRGAKKNVSARDYSSNRRNCAKRRIPPLWPPCHALVLRHDRNGFARNHREHQKESQLRDIERIRNKNAELRRKAEVRRCQGTGERG